MDRPLALVVDRDPAVRAIIRDVLEERGVTTLGAGNEEEAVDALGHPALQILFVDLARPEQTGELIRRANRLDPPPLLIGVGSRGDTVEASAFADVIPKPLDETGLQRVSGWVLRQVDLSQQLRRVRQELQSREGYHGLVGRSPAMERLRQQLDQLAATNVPIWFSGEHGSGKELAARVVHGLSVRKEKPFVVIGCSELVPASWESMWFGRSESAGPALNARAEGGTLYLDEVAELSITMQEALLEFLASPDVAGADPASADNAGVRILAASTWDSRMAIEQGRVLEELYTALAGATLQLPPLAERPEDIALLARHFVTRISEVNQLQPIRISVEAMQRLEGYAWPGNVQELRNAVEHAAILAVDGVIRPRDLPEKIVEGDVLLPPGAAAQAAGGKFRDAKREVVEAFERSYLSRLLENHGGNVTSASEQAGMLRSALQRLLRKHGLKSAEFRTSEAGRRPSTGLKTHELD